MATVLVVAFIVHRCPEGMTKKYVNATIIAKLHMSFSVMKGDFLVVLNKFYLLKIELFLD